MPDETLGDKIKRLRGKRMTQQELADRADVSISTVRHIEQGDRHSVSLRTLLALAAALDARPGDLVDKGGALADTDAVAGFRALVRTLTSVDDLLQDIGQHEPAVTLDAARASAAYAWGLYWAGRYGELGALLPAALAEARAAVLTADHDGAGEAHDLAATVNHLAGYTLVQVGLPDPAYVAMRAAVWHGQHSSDPHRDGLSRGALAWLLLTDGRADEAARFATATALTYEPGPRASAHDVSVWGGLLITAGTAAARAGDDRSAADLISAASTAAEQNGGADRNDYDWPFGPSQVAMQATDIAVVADDHDRALAMARSMPSDPGLPRVARARHLADIAYAHQHLGHDAEALSALLVMERTAPEYLRWQPMPKNTIRELLEQEKRRGNPELRNLAHRTGVVT